MANGLVDSMVGQSSGTLPTRVQILVFAPIPSFSGVMH
jgi:hypothetical protein